MMVDTLLLRTALRHPGPATTTVGLQVLVTATYLPQAYALAQGLFAVVAGDGDRAVTAALWIAAIVAARWLLSWAHARAAARLGEDVRLGVRDEALRGVLVPEALHDPGRRDGGLRTALVDGVDGVDAYVTRYLPALAQAFLLIPVVTVLLVVVHPPAGLAAGLAAVAALTAPLLWKRLMRRRSDEHWDTYEGLGSDLLEALRGMSTLRLLGRVDQTRARLARRSEDLHRATVRAMRTSLLDTALIDLAVQGGTLAAAGLALVASVTGSGVPPAELYLALMLVSEVFRPIRDLSGAWHAGYLGTSAVPALRRLGVGGAGAVTGTPAADDRDATPAGALVLDDVSFAYPGGPAILDGVRATFEPGAVTAVVGPSGAGKTTLLDLVLTHLSPTSGRVLLGGRPVRTSEVAVVSQRPVLFEGTVRENLRVSRPDASEADLWRACTAAGIEQEVRSLPAGLDTPIASAGASLSGGQRQRIALARAVLSDRPVLLADEPTSALDPAAAQTVTETLARLATDRIVVVVAHREESLDGVERVLELARGRLTPLLDGSHV
ncbi:ATP-binding cassette domain-containing protein [Nocardioides sp. KC13]|uniref:ATP-binding cassette domain-containing protein n=1 Tax=Nocardioides turkmenicus TaxID=2711220 RepID=A0A6M1QV04_9ACTN|nr:ATP-binding cassette domain-containing protein [Nocardioides sp. KC13]NGN93705.1 ATP-binding cassette domain-containing protein [Nocardioides sp. KC13]